MKMRFDLLFCLVLYFFMINAKELLSQSIKRSQFEDSNRTDRFKKFISKFKLLSHPVVLNTGCYEANDSLNSRLDMSNDSIFLDYVGPAVTVGILSDTTRFYAVIYCIAAACYLPQLTVYTKEGRIISTRSISSGCGSDLGYSCSEFLEIESIHKIILKRREERYKYNDSTAIVPGSLKVSIHNYIFSITRSGYIRATESHALQ